MPRISGAPKKYLKFNNPPPPPPPQKKSNFVPWPKKSPEMYINDPLLKIQLLGLQKYIHPKKYWKSKFWTQKNGPSLCIYENIRALPPPPPPPLDALHLIWISIWNILSAFWIQHQLIDLSHKAILGGQSRLNYLYWNSPVVVTLRVNVTPRQRRR